MLACLAIIGPLPPPPADEATGPRRRGPSSPAPSGGSLAPLARPRSSWPALPRWAVARPSRSRDEPSRPSGGSAGRGTDWRWVPGRFVPTTIGRAGGLPGPGTFFERLDRDRTASSPRGPGRGGRRTARTRVWPPAARCLATHPSAVSTTTRTGARMRRSWTSSAPTARARLRRPRTSATRSPIWSQSPPPPPADLRMSLAVVLAPCSGAAAGLLRGAVARRAGA
jgi:hypothetical protein